MVRGYRDDVMREYRLAVLTAVAALALVVVGGLVDPDGGALACPDWPLCRGEALPSLTGRVLVEHGHRLAALAVAVLTAALAALVLRNRADPGLRRLAVAAAALVALQAALGAVTVVFGLPLLARLGHLATAATFFAVVVHLALRLRPGATGGARP
jgi:cytochrome c oxidase assembly protein subunit 15